VTEVSDEDLERLASRMAMLVSEPGEADNAGRAVASLARRLGLTGGQLKAFFLAGAVEGLRTIQPRRGGDAAAQLDRLERELSAMRHGLKLTEVQARNALRERDALRVENGVLLDQLDRARSAAQVRKFVGGAAVAAAILAAGILFVGPALRPLPEQLRAEKQASSPFLRGAVVRGGGATVRLAPEVGAALITSLPSGARVQVRQVMWRSLMQWAEVEVGGQLGYVLSTEIDLS
jgi:hypothetical protein